MRWPSPPLPPVTSATAPLSSMNHLLRSGGRPPAEGVETAGVDQLARQLVPDDLLGHAPDLDQSIEIDTGIDAHLLAQQHQLLGADIARGLWLPGEWATAEPADGRVELGDTHLEPGMGIGDGEPTRIVQVQRDRRVGPAAAHLAEHALDAHWCRPAHR